MNEATGNVADPGSMTLVLNNGDSNVQPGVVGRYSPKNPRSDLYGKIGRNTPIRVSAAVGSAPLSTRAVMEVVQWPARWDVSEADRWVALEAAGVLRRLGVPGRPLQSAPERYFGLIVADVLYWAMHGGGELTGAAPVTTQFGSLSGSPFTPISGDVKFGAGHLAEWLPPGLAIDQAATISASVSGMSESPPSWTLVHARRADGGGSGPSVLDIRGNTDGGGNQWIITLTPLPTYTVEVQLNHNGSFVSSWGPTAVPQLSDDRVHVVHFRATQVGSSIAWFLWVDGGDPVMSGTVSNQPLTGVGTIRHSYIPGTTRTPLLTGHWAITDATLDEDDVNHAYRGHVGETAGNRAVRLCSEEGVTLTTVGDLDACTPMGPQRPLRLLELLSECATAEAAGARLPILTETRDSLGLTFRTRQSFYIT